MIENGKYVVVHYTGSLEDGEVFDTSADREPLEFQLGAGTVIPGFDSAVAGMKIDDEIDIVLPPAEAYGDYDDSLLHRFPVADVRSQFEPEIGMTIGVQLDNGARVPATITEITDEIVTIDLNHPLSGKTLHFHIKLLEINDTAKYGDSCGAGGCDSCGSGCSC